MIDCHVHLKTAVGRETDFKVNLSGICGQGAIILSLPPATFFTSRQKYPFIQRLNNVLEWCKDEKDFYPFFWLDPLEEEALKQIEICCSRGIAGFKIICDRFSPSHETAMEVFRFIAAKGKPVLFHSGILWDGKVSSKYNRPLEFECLLEIPKLRFALAHVSWPWCDEAIALYGKFLNAFALNPKNSAEMFIDTTPGTPVIYRQEVLEKLYKVGYDLENNVMFGTDSYADEYNCPWVEEWLARDKEILVSSGLSDEQIDKYFGDNVRRFLGIDQSVIEKKLPLAGLN
ncbi:MAG: amidohydrolase family protein [Victivallaceae bacterium]|nr:amidohydrolase family protein [Victivallaceae bacterium]